MEIAPEFKLPLCIDEIKKCIPHRYPFLLIDRIVDLVPNKEVVGIKNISISDPILDGHFPDHPVFPGVLIVEAIAQTSAVLGHFSKKNGFESILLTEISNARFRRKVIPGDCVEIKVTVEKSRYPFYWFNGEASVDGEIAAKANISAIMK